MCYENRRQISEYASEGKVANFEHEIQIEQPSKPEEKENKKRIDKTQKTQYQIILTMVYS